MVFVGICLPSLFVFLMYVVVLRSIVCLSVSIGFGIIIEVEKIIYADILVVHYKSVPTCNSFIIGQLAWWQWYNNVASVA